VREHSFADGEGRGQILAKELLLRILLDGADQLTVHFHLVFLALFRDNVGEFLLLEDFSFPVTNFLGFGATEIIVVQSVRNRNAGNIDLSLGGDDVDLVDSSQGTSVDAEGSGDEEQTGSQLLQKHDALAFVDAGDENQDGPRSDGRTQFSLVLTERLLIRGLSLLAALRGQRTRRLLELNDARIAVLLSADLLRHRRRLLEDGGFVGLLVFDEGGLLVVHLGSREPHDSSVDLRVAGSVSHG